MKIQTVKGFRIAPPRLTFGALRLAMVYVALPFLGAMALLDMLLWAIAKYGFASCYAILCLL